jgi:hypothetical protein
MRTSTPSATPNADAPFHAVRQRFEDWRQTRKPSSPIPQALWDEAVTLAREYGVSRTAQALRLSYPSLKQRLDAALPSGPGLPPPKPAFVEFMPQVAAGLNECLVEWERPDQAVMRLHLNNARWPEVEALARLFLGADA